MFSYLLDSKNSSHPKLPTLKEASSSFSLATSSTWEWPQRRNILYVRIPKTGSRTLCTLLLRLFSHVGFGNASRMNEFEMLLKVKEPKFAQYVQKNTPEGQTGTFLAFR